MANQNKNQEVNDVLDAIERGCYFQNNTAYDDCGNEFRNEDGRCVILTESAKRSLKEQQITIPTK